MAKFNVVNKKIILNHEEIIKFQIMVYCYFHNINISNSELQCLSLLYENRDLTEFCTHAATLGYFKSSQSVRNALLRLEKDGVIEKIGDKRKSIRLHNKLNVQHSSNILLDYKTIYVNEKQKI